MAQWLENVEPLTLKGQIAVPYTWWVGDTGSRFLNAVRHEEKIWGTRCETCDAVFVPPKKNCGRCFSSLDQWVEVGTEGMVTAYTIVRFDHPMHPVKGPFAYALIQLDGADVGLLHLITEDLDKLTNGVRVKARFKEKSQRTGHILDIENFQII